MRILETKRIYLRELTINDDRNLFNLNSDPEVIKYTGDKCFKSIEEAKLFLKHYDQYKKYGFGRWAVVEKSSNEFLGWCGLKYSEQLAEVDLGFRFFKSCWNQGYATESAKACIAYGFQKLKLTNIIGRAMKENAASIRVLEKAGLLYVGEFNFDEHPGLIYRIDQAQQTSATD